jgi:hypothetical protein
MLDLIALLAVKNGLLRILALLVMFMLLLAALQHFD